MTMTDPTEADLHAYLDDELDAAARRHVEAYLATHPAQAMRMAEWRRHSEGLRSAMANPGILPPNPLLDPAVLRRRLRHRRRRRVAMVATVLLTLGVGAAGGWQARIRTGEWLSPPMEDAIQAYKLFADGIGSGMFDAPTTAVGPWLEAHFGAAGALPDLRRQGFHLVGARLLSTERGPAAMVFYQDQTGQRVSFYIRPRPQHRIEGSRRDGDLLAQYWTRGSYSFALVSPFDDARAAALQASFDQNT
jgi:anti-sigma factor RsiW